MELGRYLRIVFVSTMTLFFLVGCSTSLEEIESLIENVIGVDLPSEFEVVEDDKWASIGDLSFTYVIEFDVKNFKTLLGRINLNEWDEVSPGYYEYESPSHKGVVVNVLKNEQRVRYFYFD